MPGLMRQPVIRKYEEAGRKFPIFIFSTQGGGLYAAYHSALFLARMQDRCPIFSDHIFSLVGVSGGGLGAAIFAGSVADRKLEEQRIGCSIEGAIAKSTPHETLVRTVLERDFLGPLLWAAVFQELPAIFAHKAKTTDRADTLEQAFQAAWRSTLTNLGSKLPGDYLDRDFYGVAGTPAQPRLTLVTTIVETGRGRSFSYPHSTGPTNSTISATGRTLPFSFGFPSSRLSKAVGLSAPDPDRRALKLRVTPR